MSIMGRKYMQYKMQKSIIPYIFIKTYLTGLSPGSILNPDNEEKRTLLTTWGFHS